MGLEERVPTDTATAAPPVAAPPVDISRALDIRGWMSASELTWLAEQARAADRVIEIGCALGRATRALGDHVRGVVVSVDPWTGDYANDNGTTARWFRKLAPSGSAMFAAFQGHVGDLIASGRVQPVRATSQVAHASLAAEGLVDLVFLDGDHRAAEVARDIEMYRPLVRPGGVLAGHDYGRPDWPGVRQVVDAVFGDAVQVVETIWWVQL